MRDNNKLVRSGKHWDEISFSSHIMMDALAKHLLGLAAYKMTDIGEVMESYCKLYDTSEETWINVWGKIAKQLTEQARKKEIENYTVSATTLYLRASTYWRVALMCYCNLDDFKIEKYSKQSHLCYEKYLNLSGYPGVYIKIPYDNTYLPGHFYCSPVAEVKAPLMILIPGRDTWAEDCRWIYDSFIKRGIHCLVFDGPGQGYTLRLQKIPFRPDWENVMTPVIDYAVKNLKDIDTERIGVLGVSFGAFLMPRACAFDKRIKLCIVDPGNLNWGGHFANIFTRAMKVPAPLRSKMIYNMMDDYAWKHGVTKENIIEELRKYNNTDIVGQLTCDMLVLDGSAEINKGEAKKFYDSLKNCRKEYKLFDYDSTAQCHSQMGGYQVAAEFVGDWVRKHL